MASRKRQRENTKDADDDGSSKKHRGRPRVDGQDENAADRRRTQIRLAQRAYRQRKENTIASLRDQVTRLQSTIEEMNKAFLTLNDKIVGSNLLHLNAELARDLRDATQRFILLARTAALSGADSADSESDSPVSPSAGNSHSKAMMVSTAPNRKVIDIGMGYVKVLDDTSNSTGLTAPTAASDHSFNADIPLFDLSSGQAFGVGTESSPDFTLYSRMADPLKQMSANASFGARLPTPPPAPSYDDQYSYLKSTALQASYTFSVEETNFARRLHRGALERGFHLLATASQRPADFKRVFGLSLLYNTREVLMAKCQNILTKGIDEALELYQTPLISLGGAGLHYADRPPPNTYVVKPGQAGGHARLEDQETGFDAGVDLNIDLKNYEGEWFDPTDVSKYLESLGMHIDPRSTFAEIPMVSGGPLHFLLLNGGVVSPGGPRALSSGSSSIGTSPSLPQIPEDTIQDGAARLFPELGLNGTDGMEEAFAASDWLMGASARTPPEFLMSAWNGVQQQPGDQQQSNALTPPKSQTPEASNSTRSLTLDVGSMVDYIINRGICLGRTPGFRKRDVERAITKSVIEVV